MGASERYAQFLQRYARCILSGAFALAAVAAPFALQLDGATVDSFPASPGTRSAREEAAFRAPFPGVFNDRETVYIRCLGPDAMCRCTAEDCRGFQAVVGKIVAVAAAGGAGAALTAESYFDYAGDPGLRPLAARYYNATARAMLLALSVDTSGGDKAAQDAVSKVQAAVDGFAEDSAFDVYLTGRLAAAGASQTDIGKAFGIADGGGIVLIVLLFGYRTRSWRLTLVPIVNTVISLMFAEALCLPLAKSGAITVPSFVPKVCLFLCIALSVDYSFFHLSRFQELRRCSRPLLIAVEGMVGTAGRVVLVSGVVLLFTWLALACFPVFGVNSLGYCASITIACCIVVNMLLNPAIILSFPDFFSRTSQDACRCFTRPRPASPLDAAAGPEHNVYAKVASVVTRRPYMFGVPLLVYALFIPAAVALFTAELSVGGVQAGTDATKEAEALIARDFPQSASGAPLLVLLVAPRADLRVDGIVAVAGVASADAGVKSEAYFAAGCELAEALSSELGLPLASISGAMLHGDACMNWTSAERALGNASFYRWAWRQAVSADNASSLLTVSPPYDTFSNAAKHFVERARQAVDSFAARRVGYVVECYHPMGVEVDAEDLTERRFPWVIAATTVVVFCTIGLRYRAALVPLKLFFTIALPILFVLGCGVFVFQDGWLNWTQVPSLQSQGGLVWINPVACSFMLIGFALDYDLFLFSRIFDERKRGAFTEDRAAIIHSVATTGPVITTAGLIMALAFSGMVVQHDNPFLCQMGFTMILGVLVDTFVVRTLLVPALLAMAGRFNWWPGTMPSAVERTTLLEVV